MDGGQADTSKAGGSKPAGYESCSETALVLEPSGTHNPEFADTDVSS